MAMGADPDRESAMGDITERVARLSPEARATLERRLKEKARAAEESIPRRGGDGPVPLSFAQLRLWFFDQMEPGSPAYNMQHLARIRARLDAPALERSFREIVRRHEALRTTFVSVDGAPVQVISSEQASCLPVIDLSGFVAPERAAQSMRLAVEEIRRPFDLARGPLVRLTLLRLEEEEHLLLVTMHHIVSDGWSMGVFFQELAELYQAFSSGRPSPLPPLPIQYADFAIWQREVMRGSRLERRLSYWKKQLADLPVLELVPDRARPTVQTFRGAQHSISPFEGSDGSVEGLVAA